METTAKTSDIKGAKGILENIPPGSIVVMDRGYNDYSLFKRLTDKGVVFVTRLKDNAQHTPLRQGLINVNFQRFPTLDAKKLVNAPKMSAHHRGICHF